MRLRAAAIYLALPALVPAACGSGAGGTDRSYEVALAGVPGSFLPMAPHASAAATIRVLARQREVCWSFRALRGVPDPTRAEIRAGGAGQYGSVEATLGPRFSASGCTGQLTVAQLKAITDDPGASYLEVDSSRYPTTGAIRGQL